MKTEKEFSEYFIDSCPHESIFSDLVRHTSKNYWIDLTTHLHGYFSNEDRLLITKKAGNIFSQKIKTATPDQAWELVIRNFVENNYWNFKTINKKPPLKQTEEQKIFWTLFKYIWALVQSMIILKTAVYYFGIEGSNHPDQKSPLMVWLFFSLSASSLIFFAYRNRNDQD